MDKIDYASSSTANSQRNRARLVAAGISIPLSLALCPVLPHVAMATYRFLPFGIADSLYFMPQAAFAFSQVCHRTGYTSTEVFSPTSAVLFAVILWTAVTIIYTCIARRLPIWAALLMAPGAVCIAIIVTHLAFAALGWNMELDGP